jgi:hypothetical protein
MTAKLNMTKSNTTSKVRAGQNRVTGHPNAKRDELLAACKAHLHGDTLHSAMLESALAAIAKAEGK